MNRTIRLLTPLLLLLIQTELHAQYPIVTIVKDKINGIGPCEPSVFINPKSPNLMVASLVNDKTMQTTATKTYQNKIYISKNFGESWKGKAISSKYGDFGDPCVIADNEGYFYYFHLSDPEKLGWEGQLVMDRIVCQRSKTDPPGTGVPQLEIFSKATRKTLGCV